MSEEIQETIKRSCNLKNLYLDPNNYRFVDNNAYKKVSEEEILNDKIQRRFICNNDTEEPTGKIEFKKLKSIISSAGQLQFSGSSNAVIIANSDYIKKSDIDANVHCQNIIKLFQ